jgi:ribosomal protein L11 methyltransferase
MPWKELSFNAIPEAIDWIRILLATVDYSDQLYVTQADSSTWAFTVYLYFPDSAPSFARRQLEAVVDRLNPLYRTEQISAPETAIVEQKRSPIDPQTSIHRVGDRFVILASHVSYVAKALEIPLRLAPSHSFGSGFHPATILSLRLIERHIFPAMRTLDLGSGSGILSVAMAKLGAQVVALDNDRLAVQATQEAAIQNGVAQQIVVRQGSLGRGRELGHWMGNSPPEPHERSEPNDDFADESEGAFEAIAANILARIHIALAPDYRRALRQGATSRGLLITAGFTADYEDEMNAAFAEAGFEAIDCERLDDWVAFTHRVT